MRFIARKYTQLGFTIVELSVVMAVLGLLVLLVVFSVGSWRDGVAKDAVVSDLNNVKAAMESARNFSSGYPLAIPTSFTPTANVQLTYRSGTATSYCIDGVSTERPAVQYYIRAVSGASDVPTAGTC